VVNVTANIKDLTGDGDTPTDTGSIGVALVTADYSTDITTTVPFNVPVVDGAIAFNIDPTPAGNAHKITVYNIAGLDRWYFNVPNVTNITLTELIDGYQVSPESLDPLVPLPPSAAAVLAEAEAAVTDATNAATTAGTSAQTATTAAANVAANIATITKRRANTMLLFGDSWEFFNYGDPTSASRPSPGSRGYASWGNVILGHRLSIINKGIGGEDTLALLARMNTDLIAPDAGIKLVGSGTNDISNGRTYSQITQNLATLYTAAATHGELVIGRTIPPRTSATTPQKLLRSQVNRWIRGQAITRPGFVVFDVARAVEDPTTFDFITGYSYDGVHLSNMGATAAGQAFADTLRALVPATPIVLAAADPGNLLASLGGGFPGTAAAVPTGWTANGWSQGAPTYSKVARTDKPGQWQQIVVPTDSRGFLRSVALSQGTAFVGGDTLQFAVEFEADNLEVGVSAATQALYISLEYISAGVTTYRYDVEYYGAENENEGNRARSGVLATAPFLVPTTGSGQTLSVTIQARGGGTYRFANASLYKL